MAIQIRRENYETARAADRRDPLSGHAGSARRRVGRAGIGNTVLTSLVARRSLDRCAIKRFTKVNAL